MKLSEMAREVKEKLYGAIGRNRKEENGQETAEKDEQKAQEGQQDKKTGISSQNDEKGQETANNEATAQLEAAILAGEALKEQFEKIAKELAEALAPVIRDIVELLQTIGKTEAQIRKERLWKRYYWEKAKMSNNERRRRGIPMVRRPKRQQYRTKKRKNEKSESESPETDQEEDQEEESGQQDDGK